MKAHKKSGVLFKIIGLAIFFVGLGSAQAQDVELVVTAKQAIIKAKPSRKGKVVFRAQKGSQLVSTGLIRRGYYQVLLKTQVDGMDSVSKAWIHKSKVQVSSSMALANSGKNKPRPFRKLTFDLGFSAGQSNSTSYTEMNLGINYYFYRWLALRGSFFGRFIEGADNINGLDVSTRGIWAAGLGNQFAMTTFAGPGFRVLSDEGVFPFLEGGLILRFFGMTLGGGVKSVFINDSNGQREDRQYFLVLSGGGSI